MKQIFKKKTNVKKQKNKYMLCQDWTTSDQRRYRKGVLE